MFWYTEKIGTCGQMEAKEITDKDIEIIEVWDLLDAYQENWGQFESKVKMVEKAIKEGKKVVVACRGGMSRSNAVVLAYLLRSGMEWGEAYNLICTNPMAMIEPNLLNQIREKYVK